MSKARCPFIYVSGKRCEGLIEGAWQRANTIETWTLDNGEWHESDQTSFTPTSHIHLECSLKGDHSGSQRQTPEVMKVWGLSEVVIEGD